MTTLAALAQQLEAAGTTAVEARAPGPAAPATPTGPEALARAVTLSGLTREEISVLVLVGASDRTTLTAAFRELPVLRAVLVVEPDLRNLVGLLARTPEGWGPIAPDRCQVADLPEPAGTPAFGRTLYRQLFTFFLATQARPGGALVVLDPTLTASADHRRARDVVRDLCTGFSARFLAELNDPAEVPASFLRTVADFLFAQGDRYHALKLYLLIHESAAQPQLAWRILECWSDLTAFPQVKRWLQQEIFPAGIRESLGAQLEAARVDQEALRAETFTRNLAALQTHFPAAAAQVAAARAARANLELVELPEVPWMAYAHGGLSVQRGPYPLLVRIEGSRLSELNPPPAPEDVHAAMSPPAQRDQAHACVADWVRHAAEAHLLLCTDVSSPIPGWHRVVHLIEADAAALALLLETADLSDRLQPDRVHLFVGQQADRDFLRTLDREPNRVIPGVWFGVGPRLQAGLTAVNRLRVQRTSDNLAVLEKRYEVGHARHVLAALQGPRARPLRIVFVTSRYTTVVQYLAADFATALQRLGHAAFVLLEERSGQELGYEYLTGKLLELAPDLVFLTNHTRPELGQVFPPGLPVVTWIQDELPVLADPAHIRALGPLDLVYGYSTTVQRRYQDLGYPWVGHLPFAVLASPPAPPADACRDEVVYATHLEEVGEAPLSGLGAWLEARLSALPRIPIGTPKIEPLLREGCAALGHPLSDEVAQRLVFWCAMFARRLDRLRVADAVLAAGLPLALHGRGWETVPRFRPHARGVVAPGESLRRLFRESKVVLHINGECNLHPRVLDGFSAGGFVLGRHEDSDDLPGETADQFDLGRELLLFRDDEEMARLIRRALTDEPWRRGVIAAAQARIQRAHTYENRAAIILGDLDRRLTAFGAGSPARSVRPPTLENPAGTLGGGS